MCLEMTINVRMRNKYVSVNYIPYIIVMVIFIFVLSSFDLWIIVQLFSVYNGLCVSLFPLSISFLKRHIK